MKYKESQEFLSHVTKLASITTSVPHFCNNLDITPSTHHNWIKSHRNYAKAFYDGVQEQCAKSYNAISDIIEFSVGEKAAPSRLEAAKFLLERQERLYLANLYAHGYDITSGTLQERFKRIYEAFAHGLISPSVFKTLTAALKTESEIEDTGAVDQNIIIKIDKDEENL